MSVWRRKAIECLPESRVEFERNNSSVYDVFIELLPATVKAHKEQDKERLKMYYAFAEWCMQQKEKDLWNAAGVSFYEHLADEEVTFVEMHKWVKPAVYKQVRGLLEWRAGIEKVHQLDIHYFGQPLKDQIK